MGGRKRPPHWERTEIGRKGKAPSEEIFESFLDWGEPYLAPYLVASVSRDRRPPAYSVKFEIASSRIMNLNLHAK